MFDESMCLRKTNTICGHSLLLIGLVGLLFGGVLYFV